MNATKVSVIIPLYNAEKYIGRCLHSVLEQSYKHIEIILVDDASTDHSLSVAEAFQQEHPSIKIIKHKTNIGSMASRRDGYQAATGDSMMFVDADDTLPPDAVECLVAKQQETNADIVAGNVEKIYVDGHKERLVENLPPHATGVDMLEALLDEKVRRCLWGRLYRTILFHEHPLINLDNMTIYEDACLLHQVVVNAHVIVTVGDTVYQYNENMSSVMHRVYGIQQIESIIMANKIIADVCQPYPQLHAKMQHRIAHTVLALYSEKIAIGQLRALLRKHGMQKYGEMGAICKYLNLSDYWYAFKRFFYVRTKLSK